MAQRLSTPSGRKQVEQATTEVMAVTADAGDASLTVVQGFSIQRSSSSRTKKTLPTVADVISQMQLEAPRNPLEEQIEVAGETYHVKGIKRVYAAVGMPITSAGATNDEIQCILVPEPRNPHDPNAVAVAVGNHHVGYIPADIAEDYSEPLRELAEQQRLVTGQARIRALEGCAGGGVTRLRGSGWHPRGSRQHACVAREIEAVTY